jgi:hypothetical protein
MRRKLSKREETKLRELNLNPQMEKLVRWGWSQGKEEKYPLLKTRIRILAVYAASILAPFVILKEKMTNR